MNNFEFNSKESKKKSKKFKSFILIFMVSELDHIHNLCGIIWCHRSFTYNGVSLQSPWIDMNYKGKKSHLQK